MFMFLHWIRRWLTCFNSGLGSSWGWCRWSCCFSRKTFESGRLAPRGGIPVAMAVLMLCSPRRVDFLQSEAASAAAPVMWFHYSVIILYSLSRPTRLSSPRTNNESNQPALAARGRRTRFDFSSLLHGCVALRLSSPAPSHHGDRRQILIILICCCWLCFRSSGFLFIVF